MTPRERLPNDDDGPNAALFVNDILRGRAMLEAGHESRFAERTRACLL